MKIVVTALLVIACLILIVSIVGQSGKSAGMSGSITGGAEQLFGKQKGRALDHTLDKITKAAAVGFILCALALNAM